MFDSLISMLSERVPEQRVALFQACLERLYHDFKFNGLEDFANDMVAGADTLYDLNELDIVITNGCIELLKQQLLAFGIRLNPQHIDLNSLKPIYCLCSAVFEAEFRDDTDAVLGIISDEDLLPAEILAELTRHSYGIDSVKVTPLIAYVQPDLILRMQQILSKKYDKETTVDDAVYVPDFIQRRLQPFQGTYSGVFFDYINSGGAIGVGFEAMISISTEALAPVRNKPYEFTWELLFFALASTMSDAEIIPTVQQLITINFPAMEDHQEAQRALADYVKQREGNQ